MLLFKKIIEWIASLLSGGSSTEPVVAPPPTPPSPPSPPIVVTPSPVVGPPPNVGALPDRPGTFIFPDIYPDDLGPNPPFGNLPGLIVASKEVIGCALKASEGLGYSGEAWFKRNWPKLQALASPTFFPGAYHFCRFDTDGAAQADHFVDVIMAAGGFGQWDQMPWLDLEEGGQGHWAPGPLEKLDFATKSRLANEVTLCASKFVARFKQRTNGLRIAIYGRGIARDLGMTHFMFGADAVINPAYTASMPSMIEYGVPLDRITGWQCCGDSVVFVPGYPKIIPGWGATDYTVAIDGPNATTLEHVRNRLLARPL